MTRKQKNNGVKLKKNSNPVMMESHGVKSKIFFNENISKYL